MPKKGGKVVKMEEWEFFERKKSKTLIYRKI